MADSSYSGPGRLGDRNMTLNKDPRINKKLLKLVESMGMDGPQPDPPFTVETASMSDIEGMIAATEDGFQGLYNNLPMNVPGDENEAKTKQGSITIKGDDGHDIELTVVRRPDLKDPIPCVLYSHGGGMVFINTVNPVHMRWLTSLAVAGVVAIAVDFRNAFTKQGHTPFPAGLNDCAAAAKYIAAHKKDLGISKLILQGESGGGNLACATALKANKEGWIKDIDGVYGSVPYISGLYGESEDFKLKELPSMVENEGYFLNMKSSALWAHYYAPNDHKNPLAWPYHATEADVKGLPPHFLSMDELDPLRDEGLAYYRKLIAAGVDVAAQVNVGITHGSSLIMRQAMPEVNQAATDSVAAFARRV